MVDELHRGRFTLGWLAFNPVDSAPVLQPVVEARIIVFLKYPPKGVLVRIVDSFPTIFDLSKPKPCIQSFHPRIFRAASLRSIPGLPSSRLFPVGVILSCDVLWLMTMSGRGSYRYTAPTVDVASMQSCLGARTHMTKFALAVAFQSSHEFSICQSPTCFIRVVQVLQVRLSQAHSTMDPTLRRCILPNSW